MKLSDKAFYHKKAEKTSKVTPVLSYDQLFDAIMRQAQMIDSNSNPTPPGQVPGEPPVQDKVQFYKEVGLNDNQIEQVMKVSVDQPDGTAANPIDGQRDTLSSEEIDGTGKIAQVDDNPDDEIVSLPSSEEIADKKERERIEKMQESMTPEEKALYRDEMKVLGPNRGLTTEEYAKEKRQNDAAEAAKLQQQKEYQSLSQDQIAARERYKKILQQQERGSKDVDTLSEPIDATDTATIQQKKAWIQSLLQHIRGLQSQYNDVQREMEALRGGFSPPELKVLRQVMSADQWMSYQDALERADKDVSLPPGIEETIRQRVNSNSFSPDEKKWAENLLVSNNLSRPDRWSPEEKKLVYDLMDKDQIRRHQMLSSSVPKIPNNELGEMMVRAKDLDPRSKAIYENLVNSGRMSGKIKNSGARARLQKSLDILKSKMTKAGNHYMRLVRQLGKEEVDKGEIDNFIRDLNTEMSRSDRYYNPPAPDAPYEETTESPDFQPDESGEISDDRFTKLPPIEPGTKSKKTKVNPHTEKTPGLDGIPMPSKEDLAKLDSKSKPSPKDKVPPPRSDEPRNPPLSKLEEPIDITPPIDLPITKKYKLVDDLVQIMKGGKEVDLGDGKKQQLNKFTIERAINNMAKNPLERQVLMQRLKSSTKKEGQAAAPPAPAPKGAPAPASGAAPGVPPPAKKDTKSLTDLVDDMKTSIDSLSEKIEGGETMVGGETVIPVNTDAGPMPAPAPKVGLDITALDDAGKDYYQDYFGGYGEALSKDYSSIIDLIDTLAVDHKASLTADEITKVADLLAHGVDSSQECLDVTRKFVGSHVISTGMYKSAEFVPSSRLWNACVDILNVTLPTEAKTKVQALRKFTAKDSKIKAPKVNTKHEDTVDHDRPEDRANEDDVQLARPAHMSMCVSDSELSGAYLKLTIEWDSDDEAAKQSDNGIKQAVTSFVKGLESKKEFKDIGYLGKIKFEEFDPEAGCAIVYVRTQKPGDAPLATRSAAATDPKMSLDRARALGYMEVEEFDFEDELSPYMLMSNDLIDDTGSLVEMYAIFDKNGKIVSGPDQDHADVVEDAKAYAASQDEMLGQDAPIYNPNMDEFVE